MEETTLVRMLDMLIGRLGTIEDSQRTLHDKLDGMFEQHKQQLFMGCMFHEMDLRNHFDLPYALQVCPYDLLEWRDEKIRICITDSEKSFDIMETAQGINFLKQSPLENPYTYFKTFAAAIHEYVKPFKSTIKTIRIDLIESEGPVYDD